MSKIKNNPLLKGASGMLGDVVVYREVGGNVIMANRPRKPEVLTAHQEITRERFLRAVQYARTQLANEVTKAEYAAGITASKLSAYAVALTDYLKAPVVNAVDVSKYTGAVGELILIRASDDFRVVGVHVVVSDNAGTVIEQGEAVLQPDSFDDWRYTSTVANAALAGTKITVTASDKPGNATVKETVL